MAGMNAEPSCRRQAMTGILNSTRLAAKPKKIPSSKLRDQRIGWHLVRKTASSPKAVHSCHDMTRPPRIEAGVFSAAKTGIVEAFML